MNYDIIGDVHGHADALEQLLRHLGYRPRAGSWHLSGHRAAFVGDFIDRGPRQTETVQIVRAMVDRGDALAVMGNHEYNAIAWYTPDPDQPGEYLRKRAGKLGAKHRHQHQGFLVEVEDRPEHDQIIQWFRTLPLWLDLGGLRVIHACWDPPMIDLLAPQLLPGQRLSDQVLVRSSRQQSAEYDAIGNLLKGPEVRLPDGITFQDKDGIQRDQVRIRWWDTSARTYKQAAIVGSEEQRRHIPELPLPDSPSPITVVTQPTVFGHYWMRGTPAVLSPLHACVDFSVARDGPLVAYRWQGEEQLSSRHLVWCD